MSRTRNAQKKREGRVRKMLRLEEKKIEEARKAEEEAARFWSIGAKDDSKRNEEEAKRQERIANKAARKKIYDEEHRL